MLVTRERGTCPLLPATFIDCATSNAQPGDGINTGYCICGGSTFPQSTAMGPDGKQLSCGYTSKPTVTTNPVTEPSKTTDTAACKVCSVVGHNNMDCTSLPNCTLQPTQAPIPTSPASFYLYLYDATADLNGDVDWFAVAMSPIAKGFSDNPGTFPKDHCDASSAASFSFDDDGVLLDPKCTSYSWTINSFSTISTKAWGKTSICGKDLKFKRNGDDCNVFEGDTQVGLCSAGTHKPMSCPTVLSGSWSAFQMYGCTGAC